MLKLVTAAILGLLLIPAAALASGNPSPSGNPDYPYQYTWKCDNGETVSSQYDHQLSPDEETRERAGLCGTSSSTPTQPTAPALKPLKLAVDKAALLRETLVDLRANRFTVRLRCSRACKVSGLLQVGWDVGNGKARILTIGAAAKPKRLAGGRFVSLPLKLSAAQLREVRAVQVPVHVRGIEAAQAVDDGAGTHLTWMRTCPVHTS